MGCFHAKDKYASSNVEYKEMPLPSLQMVNETSIFSSENEPSVTAISPVEIEQPPLVERTNEKRLTDKAARSRKHRPDGLQQFLDEGGVLALVLGEYSVPKKWNAIVASQYEEGFDELTWAEFCSRTATSNQGFNVAALDEDGQPIRVGTVYTATVRLRDDATSTKRIFLAFFGLRVEAMRPEDFVKWCAEHEMHNSVAEYRSLYYLSRFHFMGSRVLQTCANRRGALRVEMGDRFTAKNGNFRGIRFYAVSRIRAFQMRNNLLTGLETRDAKAAVLGSVLAGVTPDEIRQQILVEANS